MLGGKRNMTQPWRSWENSRFWDMSKKGGYRSLPPMGVVGLCLGLKYFPRADLPELHMIRMKVSITVRPWLGIACLPLSR